MKKLVIFFLFLFVNHTSLAASGNKSSVDSLGLNPETISAKAILEDLLVRRYSQGLSTFVDRQNFTVGAQLILTEKINTDRKKEEELEKIPADLMLGEIDLEMALRPTMTSEVREKINQFVGNYSIKSANISIGMKSTLGEQVKVKIEKWAKDRVSSEFGKSGNVIVSFYNDPIEKQKDIFEKLDQFQNLAGQLSLAFAILLGALIWSVFSLKGRKALADAASAANSANSQIETTNKSKNDKSPNADSVMETKKLESEILKANREVKEYSSRLSVMVSQSGFQVDELIRSWCNLGDDGMMRLACFSEVIGSKIGRLPVPADSIKALTDAFNKMPSVSEVEKRDLLKKIYWDLMMVVNLGPDSLDRPFAYVSNMKNAMVSELLINQNSKMKTLVTMFMPDRLRSQYVSNQDQETKLEILKQALDLGEIASEELKSYEAQLKGTIKTDDKKDVVVIDSALLKVIKALSPSEEMTLLTQLEGPGIESYKRNYVSLSFIHQWSDEQLTKLFSRAQSDEVVSYLRVKPELKNRIIALCPPITAEVAIDELDREDKMSEKDRNGYLISLVGKIEELVKTGEIDLVASFKTVKLQLVSESENEKKAA